jgi:hypothetical protein
VQELERLALMRVGAMFMTAPTKRDALGATTTPLSEHPGLVKVPVFLNKTDSFVAVCLDLL